MKDLKEVKYTKRVKSVYAFSISGVYPFDSWKYSLDVQVFGSHKGGRHPNVCVNYWLYKAEVFYAVVFEYYKINKLEKNEHRDSGIISQKIPRQYDRSIKLGRDINAFVV